MLLLCYPFQVGFRSQVIQQVFDESRKHLGVILKKLQLAVVPFNVSLCDGAVTRGQTPAQTAMDAQHYFLSVVRVVMGQ